MKHLVSITMFAVFALILSSCVISEEKDNSSKNENVQNISELQENIEPEDSDETLVAQVAKDIHDKITAEFHAGKIKTSSEKPFSIGLIYTRDEKEKGENSYAAYLADKILMKLTQFTDTCYEVVATDDVRKKLIETSAQQLDDLFDANKSLAELGKQIPVNFGVFVEVKAVQGKEELIVKIYSVNTGKLFWGNSYRYDSDYLNYIEQAEKAEKEGDTTKAAAYIQLASAQRLGRDPYAEKKLKTVFAKLPANVRKTIKKLDVIARDVKNMRQMLARHRVTVRTAEAMKHTALRYKSEVENIKRKMSDNVLPSVDALYRSVLALTALPPADALYRSILALIVGNIKRKMPDNVLAPVDTLYRSILALVADCDKILRIKKHPKKTVPTKPLRRPHRR